MIRRARSRARVELYVAGELAVDAVHADVDHDGALLDPVALDQVRRRRRRRPARRRGGRPRRGRACASGAVVTVALAGQQQRGRSACRRGRSGRRRPPRRPRASTSWRRSSSMHAERRARPQARAGPWPAGRWRSASGRRRPCPGRSPRSARGPSTCGGVGSWSRMPLTAGSALSSCSSARTSVVATRPRRAGGRSRGCRPRRSPSACRRRRSRTRGRRRPGPSPGRAARGRPRPRPRPRRGPRRGPPGRSPCRRSERHRGAPG